ncbi:alpha-1,4-N-acetylglucosaminyltransferase [Xenopus laevis]|uniref:Alpha 1,4-glycosyltransferase domain-containing protein n=2 Tax=Xenopus laevis TaxID=8355 RepID=A0A974HI64_XENLA|nr:alpha-1,4-N-acetylglucosaminyltransferase [Xenopus laevis]OCT78904.1 hypothetical protein XELAEV_18029993mg [Xenopus laevis]
MAIMNGIKISGIFLFALSIGFVYKTTRKQLSFEYFPTLFSKTLSNTHIITFTNTNASMNPDEILKDGNGVIFLETTDRMEPPSLVLCAIESAAHVYPDRPVVFFMKGLEDINSVEDEKRAKERFPSLSAFENVFIFPLRMEELFKDTPLLEWLLKAKERWEPYWIHNLSDACRMAMIWRYGGLYFDADVISMRPIPEKNFLTAQSTDTSGSSVFGFSPHNKFVWKCLNDFVLNYRGDIWGYQGPGLFTRVLKPLCATDLKVEEDIICGNISCLNPERIYPIPYQNWREYFEVWKELPSFNNSYGVHLWNYMNRDENKSVVPGSNTLVDRLYKQYCPTVYGSL